MKYKNIKSGIHNFAHSFCSLMNYFDDTYIIDLLPGELKKAESQTIKINFSTKETLGLSKLNPILVKSIQEYKKSLHLHLKAQNIDPQKVMEVELTLSLNSKSAIQCHISCKDDRGKNYSIPVNLGLKP